MNPSNKISWPLIAAVGFGISFVGYCVYFDRKRRSAPDFAEKLKEKRKKAKQQSVTPKQSNIDPADPEAMRQYFLEKIQLGEDCLARGDLDNGVNHLATAVVVCSQPQSLLGVFQQTLPPEVFQELIVRLPSVAESIHGSISAMSAGNGSMVTEPELE